MTRRHLLAGLGAGLIGTAAGAAPLKAAAAVGRSPATDLERAGIAEWSAHVGARFDVAGGGSLRLVAVEPLGSGGPMPSRSQCFAAVFEGAAGPVPEGNATLAVAAPGARPMPLYFGARFPAGRRSRLIAVFN